MTFVLLPLSTLIALVLTNLVRKRALKAKRLDIPNERSSHSDPTPHGAGIALVVAFILCLFFLLIANKISNNEFIAIGLPSFFVALIGRLDDLGKLTSAKWRLAGHFICAAVALWLVDGLAPLTVTNSPIAFGPTGNFLAVIYLVWMLNLFNFMDGIDLITGIETLTSCGALAIFLFVKTETDFWLVPAILAASVLGFMFLNIPPAKIFLGDVGSGFIGFVIATTSLIVAHENALIAWSIVILLAVFVSDATVTLMRRLIRRENVYIAHRLHAYQNLSARSNSHLKVSLGIGAINILWLMPIAWLVSNENIQPIVGLVSAYLPLVALAIFFKAGQRSIS